MEDLFMSFENGVLSDKNLSENAKTVITEAVKVVIDSMKHRGSLVVSHFDIWDRLNHDEINDLELTQALHLATSLCYLVKADLGCADKMQFYVVNLLHTKTFLES